GRRHRSGWARRRRGRPCRRRPKRDRGDPGGRLVSPLVGEHLASLHGPAGSVVVKWSMPRPPITVKGPFTEAERGAQAPPPVSASWTPTRSTQKTPGGWTRLVVHTPGDAVSGAPTASGRNHAAARTSALGAPRCVRN